MEYYDNLSSPWIQDDSPPPSNFSLASNATTSAKTPSVPVCRNPAYFYAMGIVIPIGFLSNVFCLTVFTLSAGLRRTTTGHYLTALACADTLFLVGDFLRWVNTGGCLSFSFLHTSNVACKLIYWLRYGAKLVSAWVTVSIATERFITVSFPLKVSRLSTVGRAKVIIVALYVIGFSLGSYALWTLESDPHPTHPIRCLTPNRLRARYNAWNTVVNMAGTLVVPGILITILTTMTVVILLRASRRRMEHMEGQPMPSPGGAGGGRSTVKTPIGASRDGGVVRRQSSSGAAERQLTATLVAVCVAFIVLRLPNTVVYFMTETLSMKTWPRVKVALTAARLVTDVIATSNYVVNLMLYCLFGSYFRQQVVAVYGCRRRQGIRRHFGSDKEKGMVVSIMGNGSDYYSKSRASTITRGSIV